MSQSDFVSRGQALVAAGQFQEAVKVCRLGLLGRPTTVEGRVVLGSALLALKRYDEVLAEMRVALELDHTAVPAHALKAEALLKKGDNQAAAEALAEAQRLAPNDPRIQQLLADSRGPAARSSAVAFVGTGDTKHYPNHASGDGSAETPDPDSSSESFTKPTSLSSPGAPRRTSSGMQAAKPKTPGPGLLHRDPTPSPLVLAVGDKSGTVEVDPERDGVELDDDLDFDDLAAPPAATPAPKPAQRGAVVKSLKDQKPKPNDKRRPEKRTPTMNLAIDDDSDVLEVDETASRPSAPAVGGLIEGTTRQGPGVRKPGGTAVRNAVQMPSGPIDIGPPPPLAQALAGQPHSMHPAPPVPLPPVPQAPRGPLAAALPTVAAMHPPPPMAPQNGYPPPSAFQQTLVPPSLGGPILPPAPAPAHTPIAQRQTMIAAAQPPPPNAFTPPQPAPNWGAPMPQAPDPRSLAAAQEPTMRPVAMDPNLQAMLAGMPVEHPSAQMIDPGPQSTPAIKRTGVRKTRSKWQIAMWILVGIVVIGGGVFAGFQIRAIRLKKQVAVARSHAMELAKSDTYVGWSAARDELSRIVQASGTHENQVALARARAMIAFEFDDGLNDAKVTVDALADKTGVDANIAAAYLALAQSDPKAARLAADAALSDAPNDGGANYVASQVALAAGDLADAIKKGKVAVDKDPRPLYTVGLARAYAAASNWPDAMASLDRAFAAAADQPSAAIERALVVARSGKATTDAKAAGDVRALLAKVVGDPKKSGVSQAQIGFGFLSLAELDFARNDQNAARADIKAAGDVGIDDQRFTEQAVESLYRIGQLSHARRFATDGLTPFAKSTRLRVSLARIDLAQGRGNDALAVLKEVSDIAKEPDALAVRGEAKLEAGDIEGARADLEAAQKLAPKLESAIVGRAWVELAAGDPEAAHKQLTEIADRSASPAVVTANAAILRRDPTTRDTAKTNLEAIVNGAPGPDVARAQLELARVYHDLGDFAAARKAYAGASQTGNFEARLESGLIMIEDRDPLGGRDTLDALLKEAGEHPTAQLVLETARARMLAGDHAGAASLLAMADTMANVPKWQLQRERGRLHLRRGDVKAAITELGSALEGCGSDAETFLLAADAATTTENASGLADKLKKLAPERLKGQPEALIVTGKLLLGGNPNDAEVPYRSAREQLRTMKAAPRRIAQANYGLAVVAYNKSHDPEAMDDLNMVLSDDPSIYDAYLFLSDVNKNKVAAFEAAKTAVKFNPDYPRAWNVLGKLAAKNNDQATLAQAIEKLDVLAPGTEDLAALKKLKK